ncbi:MAG: hypothetical protein PVF27_04780 [Gemmatimonadales bacterium]|jgi:hypothetical protein
MVPHFSMPNRTHTRRAAVMAELRQRLEAARCTVQLLHRSAVSARDRELLEQLSDELDELHVALERLATGP